MMDYLERHLVPEWIDIEKSVRSIYGDHLFRITMNDITRERSNEIYSRFPYLKHRRLRGKVNFIYCKQVKQVYDVLSFCADDVCSVTGPTSEKQLTVAQGNTHSIVDYISSDRLWYNRYCYRIEVHNLDTWYYQTDSTSEVKEFQKYMSQFLKDNQMQYKIMAGWFETRYYLTEEDGEDFLFSAMLTHGKMLKGKTRYVRIAKRVVE